MFKILTSLQRRVASFCLEPFNRWAYKYYYNYPFGKLPRATDAEYKEFWEKAKKQVYPMINQFEAAHRYAIDEKWFHDLGLLTQIYEGAKGVHCYQHGRVLYSALSHYISRNRLESINIVETGTARGFSSLCMAKALNDINQAGKIVTLDIIPHEVKMYWNCIADNEKGSVSRSDLLYNYNDLIEKYILFIQGDSIIQAEKIKIPRVHFAFLDGQHTYKYVVKEFEFLLRGKQQTGDILIFDDYTPKLFPGVVKAVDEICETYEYSKEILTIDEERGYVVARKN